MTEPILVTGATGTVGKHVVRCLLKRGIEVIAAGQNETKVRQMFPDSVTPVRLDFLHRNSWADAIGGSAHMFLMRPPAISKVRTSLNPFIDFARDQGVDHIVFLSVAGAGRNSVVPHYKVEKHLRLRGKHHTNLRPGFFAQNLETAYRLDICQDDRIYVPAGRRSVVNWIDVRDIAEVAALIFADPTPHQAMSYTLTGPGSVPWSKVTDALSRVLGRKIRYEPASVLGYIRHLSRRGLPRGAILVQTILHVLLRFGQGAKMDDTLERLLKRSGRSIQQYIEDNAEQWMTQ